MLPATTPQEGPKCLSHSPCIQPACLTCFPSTTGDHHEQDLPQTNKPTAPPDHIISTISEDFQQDFINNNLDEIQDLLEAFKLHVQTNPDYIKFDRTKLTKYVNTARQLTESFKKTTESYPAALPNHLISILSTQLKQATLDNDLESINTLLHLSACYWENPIWYLYGGYDFDVLLDSVKTAYKLTTTQTHPSPAFTKPPAPPDHWISLRTTGLIKAILCDGGPDMLKLKNIYNLCMQILYKDFKAFKFDRSRLHGLLKLSNDIIDSATPILLQTT